MLLTYTRKLSALVSMTLQILSFYPLDCTHCCIVSTVTYVNIAWSYLSFYGNWSDRVIQTSDSTSSKIFLFINLSEWHKLQISNFNLTAQIHVVFWLETNFHNWIFSQLRKPVSSSQSIPSMKSGKGENNKDSSCNEEAGVALVGVHSEYPG